MATSPDMNVDKIAYWSGLKGMNIMGTGDFTHPLYFNELKNKLDEAEPGLHKLKKEDKPVRFVLTAEVSNIFSCGSESKRIHTVIFASDFGSAERLNQKLSAYGKLSSDGRPIFTFHVKDLVKMSLDISDRFFIVPAHAWTPWFSIFGSKSGFNSIEEVFEEETKNIFAIETGLSSDPSMNWRLSKLDDIALISNSDAHSPAKIGREANVFECDLNYDSIIKTIKSKDKNKFLFTIEFFPEEGKYHYDGHRSCNISQHPGESIKSDNRCPACGRELTVGVLHRVEELADREDGYVPENAIPQKHLVPLVEIIAEAMGQKTGTKAVETEYLKMVSAGGSEMNVLINIPLEELKKFSKQNIAEGIIRAREGRVLKIAGYDGVYGKISVFSDPDKKSSSDSVNGQMKLL